MTRPTAFVGELARLAIDNGRRTLVVYVGVPLCEFDALQKGLGLPPRPEDLDDPAHMRAVALLPCRTVRHPQGEADVLAEAMARELTALFRDGHLGDRLRPVLHEQMAALFDAAEAAWLLPPARSEPDTTEV